MKKLALIVILALVASRVLSDRDDSRDPGSRRSPSIFMTMFDDDTPAALPPPVAIPHPPAPPLARAPEIRTIPWRGESPDGPAPRVARSKRRGATRPAEPAVPEAPKTTPPWFPKSELDEDELARPDARGVRILLGRLSISEERAKADLRKTVNREIADWLAADIPLTWTPPAKLVDRMNLGTYIQPATWSFGPRSGEATPGLPPSAKAAVPELDEPQLMYRAGQRLDFSSTRRAAFVEAYHRDVASARMRRSGSVIAVVLTVLALTSLYVRADEATKGYYTNRLRVLATLGLGAAGAVAYRYWA